MRFLFLIEINVIIVHNEQNTVAGSNKVNSFRILLGKIYLDCSIKVVDKIFAVFAQCKQAVSIIHNTETIHVFKSGPAAVIKRINFFTGKLGAQREMFCRTCNNQTLFTAKQRLVIERIHPIVSWSAADNKAVA